MLSSEVFTLSMQTRDATTGAKRHIGYCIDSVNPSLERRGSERTLPSSRRHTVCYNHRQATVENKVIGGDCRKTRHLAQIDER